MILCGIVAALYSLAHTRSLLSFIVLCGVMAIAIAAAAWYTAIDQQQ
jgi:uncharacterized membrane protein YidH (DUF202 family)